MTRSILDLPMISGRYLFPQTRRVADAEMIDVGDAKLACFRRTVNFDGLTLVHFHGNGEAVADYVPDMAEKFADLGLNSFFVEYRGYGDSTGDARLVAMLGDGERAMKEAGIDPARTIAMGRSIGSLYAIELVSRVPSIAGLILESGIADPYERFLTKADVARSGFSEQEMLAETKLHFHHKKKLLKYSNPMLVMHTENDGIVDITHAERLHKWASSRQKRLVRFSRGDHNTIFATNQNDYLAAIATLAKTIESQSATQ